VSLNRSTVLVVEDDPGARTTLLRILGALYNVTIAEDGAAALWLMESGQRFDVVLCDVRMPKMDGVTFVERLVQLDADQARRVIVVTGDPSSARAARLSSHYFVGKPYNVRELRELVARVIAAAQDGYFPAPGSR
jgi:CheY-like chemotaxis protein